MNKSRFSQKLFHILFWSIITAAFIGPGTVTTASKAGASYGFALIWALVFSTIATIFLQEAAARLSLVSQKNIGQILKDKYGKKSKVYAILIFVAIAFGCAAYQTGNILGAVSGLALFSDIHKNIWIGIIAIVCVSLLWNGNFRRIANVLGVVVALMGIIFIYVAINSGVSSAEIVGGSIGMRMPEGSALLVIGLIGTTIVPYNLFLGSGISKGQQINDMRLGLTVAVLIGGLISIAILLVGTQVQGEFSFESLAQTLSKNTGNWMVGFFGFGLFAAGLSSSITAPFAAAVSAQSLFQSNTEEWHSSSLKFRSVWMIVLLIGLGFGLANIKPIPAIIFAQAINGILLPIVAIWLLIFVNDKVLMGYYANQLWQNLILFLIVWICAFLGLFNVWNALIKMFGWEFSYNSTPVLVVLSTLILLPIFYKIIKDQN